MLIDPQGRAYLTDFGIALVEEDLPRVFTAAGTLPYMDSEQLGEGPPGPVDHRADLYALGAVLYEAISGVLPSGAIVGGRPPAGASGPLPLDQRVPHVPEPLARVVMQLLAPRPELRPRDAFVVLDELTTILRDHGRGREPRWCW